MGKIINQMDVLVDNTMLSIKKIALPNNKKALGYHMYYTLVRAKLLSL